MIEFIQKDLTTIERGVVVHGVNCQGRMGSGVALAIRNKWPEVYERYRSVDVSVPATNKQKLLGSFHLIKVAEELYVGNLYTQVYYGNDGKQYANCGAIRQCLMGTAAHASVYQLPVYLPRIGCGLGGLKWDLDVGPILDDVAHTYNKINFFVCDI